MYTDCRHYRVAEPCAPHKLTGIRCVECRHHDPIAERILIVKLGALGDVLRTTCCLPPLHVRHPHSHVTWLTRSDAAPLLVRNRGIDRVLTVDTNYLEYLLTEHFDLLLAPDADPLSAAIAGLARAGVKRGFIADGRGGVTPLNEAAACWWRMGVDDELKRRNRRTYGEWLYAICELPTPVARPQLELPGELLALTNEALNAQTPDATTRICFNTGASTRWQEKKWKPRHYLELARRITSADPRAAIILVGGPEERAFNHELLSAAGTFVDGGTRNSVEEFAATIAACDWVLTPDSLGYHVACAVGTPAVCLVGPTSPWEIDLFGVNRVIYSPFDCIACYRATCPKSNTCMDALTPSRVLASVRQQRPNRDSRPSPPPLAYAD